MTCLEEQNVKAQQSVSVSGILQNITLLLLIHSITEDSQDSFPRGFLNFFLCLRDTCMPLAIFSGELSNCKVLTVCSSLSGRCHADDGYTVQESKLAEKTLMANNRAHAAKPSSVRSLSPDIYEMACFHTQQFLIILHYSINTACAGNLTFKNSYVRGRLI